MFLKLTFISQYWLWVIVVFAALLLIFIWFWGKDRTGVYLKKTFKAQRGTLKYRIIYPDGFDKSEKYPLLLFLHGAGERGYDNAAQLKHGGTLIKDGMNKFRSIAILPQCPKENYWMGLLNTKNRPDEARDFAPDENNPPSLALSKVIDLLETMIEQTYIDKSRIYVAGLSMGGMGVFDLCWRMPNLFAAAIAVCGTGSPLKAYRFAKLPIRIYHGDEDDVVSVDESLEMIAALEDLGGSPEAFIYPGVKHDSWENAFAEPDFLSWLYEQKRS